MRLPDEASESAVNRAGHAPPVPTIPYATEPARKDAVWPLGVASLLLSLAAPAAGVWALKSGPWPLIPPAVVIVCAFVADIVAFGLAVHVIRRRRGPGSAGWKWGLCGLVLSTMGLLGGAFLLYFLVTFPRC